MRGQQRGVYLPLPPRDPELDALRIRGIAETSRLEPGDAPLAELSECLDVSQESLLSLCVGWSTTDLVWYFPMRDAAGDIIGIRERTYWGQKYSVRGSREGLFIPLDLRYQGPLLICEGPPDTAAALDLGYDAIGRPSCTGGIRLVAEYVRRTRRYDVVVVADCDEAGIRGAEELVTAVSREASTRLVIPPDEAKDLRQWMLSGDARGELPQAIAAAAPIYSYDPLRRARRRAVAYLTKTSRQKRR